MATSRPVRDESDTGGSTRVMSNYIGVSVEWSDIDLRLFGLLDLMTPEK